LGLLEPNAVAGLTNRLLAPLVDEIWGPFLTGAGSNSARFHRTGTPVREAYLHAPTREQAIAQLGLDASRTIVLVIGGSQGARSLNAALAQIFRQPLARNWQFVQIAGNESAAEAQSDGAEAIARGEAKVFGYLDDPIAAYAAADIVVARAGASTLAELAALGKPAVLVPYPFATDDHQRKNAEGYVALGAGRLLPDAELNGDRLMAVLDEMLQAEMLHALTLAAQKLSAEDAAMAILDRVSSYRSS
jgi:UDP-N-acetylglucosamine--N-acetylmuramyl-(pentapeptide) pyrophosphoryl-undecaprenol N-acetylglucosamine transferase